MLWRVRVRGFAVYPARAMRVEPVRVRVAWASVAALLFVLLLVPGAVLASGSEDEPEALAPEDETQDPTGEADGQTPPPHSETVVVTASRNEEPLRDAAAFVTPVDGEDLAESPGMLVDEALSRVPGFGLFRRNTSFISHPTTTGVSLRGIGPSGASRTLVLWDGIPMNDPFGNWVYWNRLPTLYLDRAEVARGAASPLYGSSALGGTIQLLSRSPEPGQFRARGRFGSFGVQDGEVLASHAAGGVSVIGAARILNSDGYHRIREDERGSVDEPAGVDFRSMVGRAVAGPAHFSINYYAEDRRNGTPIQVNDSRTVFMEGGVSGDEWDLRAFGQSSRMNSDFSRILPGRNQEIPTSQQMYEYSGLGGAFSTRLGDGLQAGADWIRSSWDEHVQNRLGAFVQKRLMLQPGLELTADGRLDLWQNAGTRASVNPRLGLRYRVSPAATLRTSAYRGFRAPSLNELYRPFRVGNVRTAANDALTEESLYGAEAGVDLHPNARWLVRGNVWWNSLRNTVGNITLEVNDQGVFRQRQNIGRAGARGAEAELWAFPSDRLEFFAAYLLSATEVEETGLRIPQVPLHQGSLGFVWRGPAVVRADVRFLSEQFEDDRNELPMAGFAAVGVRVSYPISSQVTAFAAGENLLDAEIVSARTPIETLGTPRALHVGLDFDLSR